MYTFSYNVMVNVVSLIMCAAIERAVVSSDFFPMSMKVISHDTDEVQLAALI